MTTAEKRYGDIIDGKRPEFDDIRSKYPPQPLSERAKIFSPFAALRGHGESLMAEDEKLLLSERPELSEEVKDRLNETITGLEKGMTVTLWVFETVDEDQGLGRFLHLTGKVQGIEPAYSTLRLKVRGEDDSSHETVISFLDIYDAAVEEH